MEDLTSHFSNSDGKTIFCKYWYPKHYNNQQLKVSVYICHGANEHCQVYNHVAESLTDKGVLVFSHDHVGHGLSEGDRVHVNHGSTYVNDVVQHVNIIKSKHIGVCVLIIGHSMGGLIALKTALDYPDLFTGVLLIGPALVVDPKLSSPFMICLAKSVASMMPQMQLKGIDPQLICRDQNVVKRYTEDPLVWHGGTKARWGLCLLEMINNVNDRLAEVSFPLFIMHGSEDRLCLLSGSKHLYDSAITANKLLKIYPGAYHQVHNEPDGIGEEAIADIVEWIVNLGETIATTP